MLGNAIEGNTREFDPDRQRGAGPFLAGSERQIVVVADPDDRGEIPIETSKPGVTAVVGRPRFT